MTPTASICACHRVALERLAAVGEKAFGSLRVVAVSAWLTIIDTGKVSVHEKELLIERTNITMVASKTILTAGELGARCSSEIDKECRMQID